MVEVLRGFVLVFEAEVGHAFAVDAVYQDCRIGVDVGAVVPGVEAVVFRPRVEALAFGLLPVKGEVGLARTRAEDGAHVFVAFLDEFAAFVVYVGADADLFVQFEGSRAEVERRAFVVRGFERCLERGGVVGVCRINAEVARVDVFAKLLMRVEFVAVCALCRRVVGYILRNSGSVGGFCMAAVVGVVCLHADVLADVIGADAIHLVRRALNRFAVGIPLVMDAGFRHAVGIGDGGGQHRADFCRAAEGYRARVRVGGGDVGRRAGRGFVVRRLVVVGRLYADFVPGVFGFEGVGFAGCAADGLAVALPLVLDLRRVNAVAVGDLRGQYAADFGFTGDVDAARLVGRVFADGGGRLAGDAFGVRLAVGVFGFDGDALAFVRRADLVGRALPDFCAVGKPAVGDGADAVGVLQVVRGGEGLADFCRAADGDAAGRRVVVRGRRGDGAAVQGFFDAAAVLVFGVQGDGFACVGGLQGVGFAGGAVDGFAVAPPLVLHFGRVNAVVVADFRGEVRAYFRFAADAQGAEVVDEFRALVLVDVLIAVDAVQVALGAGKRRHLVAVFFYGLRAVVVGGEGEVDVVEAVELCFEVAHAAIDVLRGVVRVDTEHLGGGGRELHQADGAVGRGDVFLPVGAFYADDGVDERLVDVVFVRGAVDEVFVLRLAGEEVRADAGIDVAGGDIALDAFRVPGEVGVARADADNFVFLGIGEGVAAAGRATDGGAIGKPLIFHLVRHAIRVGNRGC